MIEQLMAAFAAGGLALVGYTGALILANWWADMFYTRDGEPTHCTECGSPFLHEQPASFEANVVSEAYTICSDCSADVAFWAHGSFSPCYREQVVDDVMSWGRWFGPLTAVGVALCLI